VFHFCFRRLALCLCEDVWWQAWRYCPTHAFEEPLGSPPCVLTDMQGWPEPYIYGVYMVFLAWKSPNIRSHTVFIDGSGHPYKYADMSLLPTLLKHVGAHIVNVWFWPSLTFTCFHASGVQDTAITRAGW